MQSITCKESLRQIKKDVK